MGIGLGGLKNLFKPERKPLKIQGRDLRKARDRQEVKNILAESMEQEARLEREGLIHP